MAVVWIPALVRDLTRGTAQVHVSGATLRQVIDNLECRYPGLKARLCQDDGLVPHVAAFVDGRRAWLGVSQPVGEQSEIHFLPATAGG